MAILRPTRTPLFIPPQGEACILVDEPNSSTHRRHRMSAYTFRSSRPDHWVMPRPTRDPARGRAIHGPLQPMAQPGFLSRLLALR
jgi:hypothetical protein